MRCAALTFKKISIKMYADLIFLCVLLIGIAVSDLQQPLVDVMHQKALSTTSAAYIPSELIPELSTFTACLWFKLSSQHIQNLHGLTDHLFIYNYQNGVVSGVDIMYLYIHRPTMTLLFEIDGGGIASLKGSDVGIDYFDDQWRHVCTKWSSLGGEKHLLISGINGDGAYVYGDNVDAIKLLTPIEAGKVGGSWLLMAEQDAQSSGTGVGNLDAEQAMIGMISGFQLYQFGLPIDQIMLTGCGLRADIFDSFYDSLSILNEHLALTQQRHVMVPFCSPDKGRLMVPDKSHGVFSYFNGYKLLSGVAYLAQLESSGMTLRGCVMACQRTEGCVTVQVEGFAGVRCMLSDQSLTDLIYDDALSVETAPSYVTIATASQLNQTDFDRLIGHTNP